MATTLEQVNVIIKSREKSGFFGLSRKEAERVVKEATRAASRDQRELEERYDREFQKA
jgi:hypothetical protein